MRGNAADARDMGGSEDEAGAVHDDAGKVHSDVPGGVGEAGVVHALVHDVGDMLRAVHTAGEVSSNVGNVEDVCGVYTRWRTRTATCAIKGHARRRGRRGGRARRHAQCGGRARRCARRGGMHGDVNGAEDVHGGVPHVCGTVHNVKEVGSDVRDAEDGYRGVYDLEGARGEDVRGGVPHVCGTVHIVKEVGGDVRDAEDVYWGVYDLEGACGEDVHGAAHNVEGSRGDVRDEGTCAATWTAPRMCAAPRTMRGGAGQRGGRGRCPRRRGQWTASLQHLAGVLRGYSARIRKKITSWSQGQKAEKAGGSFDNLRPLRVVFRLNVEGSLTR
ncbi:hypothetical protein B0H10DRAFT_1964853 [Mycena sp. CBHHK59/15]|nr:hypothetical protein B0H10DRAFT_1964853 [Mycena sp. CBHHK59/15]